MNNTNFSRRDALGKASIAGLGAAWVLATKTSRAQDAMPADATDKATTETMAKADAMPQMAAPSGDLDVVRFALQMEQLEAAYFAQIVGAHQKRAYLPARQFELTQQIATAKAAHVAALEAVLSGANQSVPDAPAFQFPAEAFLSPITGAWLGYTLEEIGIGAYLGAVGSIQSDEIRRAAASIYGVKAQHAAILRTFASFDFAPKYYEVPLSVEQVTQLTASYIA